MSLWFRDYLCEKSTYTRGQFKRRFGVQKIVFIKIHDDLIEHKPRTWETKNGDERDGDTIV